MGQRRQNQNKTPTGDTREEGQSCERRGASPGDENYKLKFLDSAQVSMVDEALASLGEYGEVRLVIEKGRLRFLVTQTSFDALRWQPGSLSG